ncbi:hypothetical protein ACRZ5S_19555 [Vibrio scophthalmi]|uniref:hypothetical protein n=1 Tax=Vibrio scophthalmi TaxID=45658 RepID=UPI003EBD04F3
MKDMTRRMIKAIEYVEPHSTLIKVKNSELRYVSKQLIVHNLVVRVDGNKNVYIPKNHYQLIYDAISETSEFQNLIHNDLQNRIRQSIIQWKKGKRIKFDTPLSNTSLKKYVKIIRKQRGTLKKAYIRVDGALKEYVMIDQRLVQHLENELNLKEIQ